MLISTQRLEGNQLFIEANSARNSLSETTTLISDNISEVRYLTTDVSERNTQLLRHEDLLAEAIFEKCIANASPVDAHCVLRNFALVTSSIASLSSGAAYVPISLHLPVGPLFATANFIGFFKLDMWAIRETINDFLGPKGEKELVLLERATNGKCFTAAIMTAAIAIALLSQTPVALPALDYDAKLKIPAVLCLYLGSSLVPIRSLQMMLEGTIRARDNSLGEIGKKIESLRTIMASMIDQYREIFRKIDYSNQLEQITQISQIQGTDLQMARTFVEKILEQPLEIQEIQERSILDHCFRGLGFLIAGSLQAGLAIYTFEKTKQHVIDDDIAAGSLACSVVLSGIYLSGLSIINTAERISRSFQNFISSREEKTIAEQLRPKLTLALKLLGVIIDLGALGATIVIWDDFYKDNIPPKIYFDITLCLAYFLFLSTSTLDMVDEAIEEIIQRDGNHQEIQIVQLNHKLKKMKKIIEQSSILDFSIFLEMLTERSKTKLLDRVNLTIENLVDSTHSLQNR